MPPKPPQKITVYERQGSNNAGYGSYGHVYFYHLVEDHKKVFAIKFIAQENIRQQEVAILQSCAHENIVRYIDYGLEDGYCFIVTELLNSSLYDAFRAAERSLFELTPTSKGYRIYQRKFLPKLSVAEMFQTAEDCFQGLMYLHEKGIIHRDIYPANILLQVDYKKGRSITAKLCDFGLSKLGTDGHQTVLQNVPYSAPETTNVSETNSDGYSLKADVFSLGVVISEMICNLAGVRKKDIYGREEKFERGVRVNWERTIKKGTKFGSLKAVRFAGVAQLVMDMTLGDPKTRVDVNRAHDAWKVFHDTMKDGNDSDDDADDNPSAKGGVDESAHMEVGDESEDKFQEALVPQKTLNPLTDADESAHMEVADESADMFQEALVRLKMLNPLVTEEDVRALLCRT